MNVKKFESKVIKKGNSTKFSLLPEKQFGLPLLIFFVSNLFLVALVGIRNLELPFIFLPQVAALFSLVWLAYWLFMRLKGEATFFKVETSTEKEGK
jgi:hypothetical protein